jgi:hypothetical protein
MCSYFQKFQTVLNFSRKIGPFDTQHWKKKPSTGAKTKQLVLTWIAASNSARPLCHVLSDRCQKKAVAGKRLAGFDCQMIWQGH